MYRTLRPGTRTTGGEWRRGSQEAKTLSDSVSLTPLVQKYNTHRAIDSDDESVKQ